MKSLKAITQWFRKLREQYHEAQHQKRSRYLDNLSCDAINVIEFNGRLHIAYEGVPIVRVDDLKGKVPELLAQSREDYLAWKAKFNA